MGKYVLPLRVALHQLHNKNRALVENADVEILENGEDSVSIEMEGIFNSNNQTVEFNPSGAPSHPRQRLHPPQPPCQQRRSCLGPSVYDQCRNADY